MAHLRKSRSTKSKKLAINVILVAFILAASLVPPAFADAGDALDFNGTTNYVALGDTGDLMGTNGWVDSMTISVWLKPTDLTPTVNSPIVGELIVGTDYPRVFGITRAVYTAPD